MILTALLAIAVFAKRNGYRSTQLDMIARHLGEVSLGLFAAKSYLDRAGPLHGFDDISNHDFVGYDSSELIIQGMCNFGIDVSRDWFPVRCEHQTAYWELVRAGCGIGFMQISIGRKDPGVQELLVDLAIPKLPVWLTTHEKLRQAPRIHRVWKHLTTHLPPLLS